MILEDSTREFGGCNSVGFPGDHPFPRCLRRLFVLTSGTCVSYCYPPVSSELRNYQKIVKANMDKSFQEQGPPQLFEKGLEKPSSYWENGVRRTEIYTA